MTRDHVTAVNQYTCFQVFTMRAYGPYTDEQLFFYADNSILYLDQCQIYDSSVQEFIGLDDLQTIYDKGKMGSYKRIFFSGVTDIGDPSILCQQGFNLLYEAVLERFPSLTPAGFERKCREGEVIVELLCQLKRMPVAYLTDRPENSVIIYSNNLFNFNSQRCYIANTWHIKCLVRSEQVLQFAMIVKFIVEAGKAKYPKKTPRDQRDVHWLVDRYMELYNKVFHHRGRPKLHRATVYDYFATYAEVLGDVIAHKIFTMDTAKWRVWIAESKEYRAKAAARGSDWGTMPLGRAKELPQRYQEREDNDEQAEAEPERMDIDRVHDLWEHRDQPPSDSESSSDDEDVHYKMDMTVKTILQRRFFKRMPLPEWYWECDLDPDCTFIINLNRPGRTANAPYMEYLNEDDRRYIIAGSWRLRARKTIRVWKKICQAHWEEHLAQAGLFVDHDKKSIVYRQV